MFRLIRKMTGWRPLRGREGFVAEFPGTAKHKCSTATTAHGQVNLAIYVANVEGGLSCQITIRSGPAVESRTDAELFADWKAEFLSAMGVSGIQVHCEAEVALAGDTGRELTFTTRNGAVLMRIRLQRDVARLAAISAIGPRDQAQTDGQRLFDSFAWTGA